MNFKISKKCPDEMTLAEALWLHQEYGLDYDVDTHSLIFAEIEYDNIAKAIFGVEAERGGE